MRYCVFLLFLCRYFLIVWYNGGRKIREDVWKLKTLWKIDINKYIKRWRYVWLNQNELWIMMMHFSCDHIIDRILYWPFCYSLWVLCLCLLIVKNKLEETKHQAILDEIKGICCGNQFYTTIQWESITSSLHIINFKILLQEWVDMSQ